MLGWRERPPRQSQSCREFTPINLHSSKPIQFSSTWRSTEDNGETVGIRFSMIAKRRVQTDMVLKKRNGNRHSWVGYGAMLRWTSRCITWKSTRQHFVPCAYINKKSIYVLDMLSYYSFFFFFFLFFWKSEYLTWHEKLIFFSLNEGGATPVWLSILEYNDGTDK